MPIPTNYAPGTAGKIEVLRFRASLELPLFVEGDCLEYDGVAVVPPRETHMTKIYDPDADRNRYRREARRRKRRSKEKL